MMHLMRRFIRYGTAAMIVAALAWPAFGQVNVVTHHYDNLRTGWNQNETTLTPSTVSSSFQLQHSIVLDEQVDAQPLLVTGETIAGQGVHDVVYVATANNSLYAIDAASGQILIHKNFGAPVPQSALPGQCDNNSSLVGINSTPVVDVTAQTMYLITYTLENGNATWRLHAVDIQSLADKISPAPVISVTGMLKNGQTTSLPAYAMRNRSALLQANGNIYTGFGSFCDFDADVARGWVLGWQAGTLSPLPANELVNKRPSSPDSFFISGVWMSGSGIASDASGDLYFATGNSDFSGTTYSATWNLSESVIRLSSDLSTVRDWFTPSGTTYGHVVLDQQDHDLGSGGVLVLPPQPGTVPNLAVIAGKVGPMFVLNRDNLGQNTNHAEPLRKTSLQPGCWCAQSYYLGQDGFGRVVSSFGNNVTVWVIKPTSTAPFVSLTKVQSFPSIATGQDPGFFTTISSNGSPARTAIIWAVSRPVDTNPAEVSLFAWKPDGTLLASLPAGTWPSPLSNANLVPVVANGKVYVASYKQLAIFGLGPGTATNIEATAVVPVASGHPRVPKATIAHPAPPPRPPLPDGVHEIYGTVITGEAGDIFVLKDRNGQAQKVGTKQAQLDFHSVPPVVGQAVMVRGTLDPTDGVFHARVVMHAKPSPALWPPDR